MTPFEARWCTDRVLDGTLEVDGDEIRVTDAGWDLILSVGAAGTELEGAELDREFVLGAAMGAGEVACLYDAIGVLEGILFAVGVGFASQERPDVGRVVVVDHQADPALDTPLQAAVRQLMEGDEA